MKQKFLLECYWGLTYRAAVMHNTVFKDRKLKGINDFKKGLKKFISELSNQYKDKAVDEVTHVNNIKEVIKFSKKYSSILIIQN